ncbi:hypothetical protein [Parasedimentitalea maritima]|uniref:Uncharacterized protein n=1 Tax=Parasedimentitalea maritima TaxID=2578117 RepID=A0A6A4RB29_9RHOB|nr:hypothetical protein [Zongyanglinia marina]KAE9626466.1 hypothetical protein GP644_20660 [Zongyanglinia marina]
MTQFGTTKCAFGKASNGSSLPWGALPARSFIVLSDEEQDNIVAELEDWLHIPATRRD